MKGGGLNNTTDLKLLLQRKIPRTFQKDTTKRQLVVRG